MKYHDITHDDMKNGDGLRVVLWVAGCGHHCPGCQNPVTWDPDDGIEFSFDAWAEIRDELSKPYISGLTLSGGDPLFPGNRETVLTLLKDVRVNFPDKTVWVYTGYRWEEIVESAEMLGMMSFVDVLVDGRFVEELKDATCPWVGSTNQRVIDVRRTLEKGTVVLHESH